MQKNHYLPEEIVCLTFSNEAAESLHKRVIGSISGENGVTIKTIHSFCADLLRKSSPEYESFRIWLPEDAIIKLHTSFKLPSNLCHKYVKAIGTAKDLGITYESCKTYVQNSLKDLPENYEKHLEDLQFKLQTLHLDRSKKKEKTPLSEEIDRLSLIVQRKKFLDTWAAYEKLKTKKNALDYGDLTMRVLELVRKKPQVLEQYKYLLVDEFQDTNKMQLELIENIAHHKNVTIVGDLNQSIYRFRGAYTDTFSYFKKQFNVSPEDVFTLDKSYRSPNTVLTLAHEIIKHNYEKPEECFFVQNAEGKEGDRVQVVELNNGKEEVRKIIEIIKDESRTRPLEEICVLYRTHQQAISLKRELEAIDIPYTAVSSQSLYKQPIIKTIVDYLTVMHRLGSKSKGGEHAWWGLVHNLSLSKEDEITFARYLKDLRQNDCPSIKIINSPFPDKISEEGKRKLDMLISRIKSLIPSLVKPVSVLLEEIYSLLEKNPETKEGRDALAHIQAFHAKALEHIEHENGDLGTLLGYIEITNTLGIDVPVPAQETSGIRIMTAHATKGLEYPIVILASFADKRFPLERYSHDSLIPYELYSEFKDVVATAGFEFAVEDHERENQLKEERRLAYVACTRAREKLYITYALDYGGKSSAPSTFLKEVDYAHNPSIEFIQDKEDKYKPTEVAIVSAATLPEKAIFFSPSSLVLYTECPKRYEYRYVYNMPEPEPLSWEAMKLGSFVHMIIEYGVKENFKQLAPFIIFAKEMHLKPEWNTLDIREALKLISVFFERNKNKYDDRSLNEQRLYLVLEGIRFQGVADRIDRHDDGLEIIDYKTGASNVSPKARNWQLGFYALASSQMGPVKRVTLDMLKHERPLEFDIDEEGNAKEINAGKMSFNLYQIEKELITTAKEILHCYKTQFPACTPEKNCPFCNEWVYKYA